MQKCENRIELENLTKRVVTSKNRLDTSENEHSRVIITNTVFEITITRQIEIAETGFKRIYLLYSLDLNTQIFKSEDGMAPCRGRNKRVSPFTIYLFLTHQT